MATAPIGPLAWEPPYAAGAAQEIAKKKKKEAKKQEFPLWLSGKRIRLGTMKFQVRSLALLSGFTIGCCREL